MMNKPKNGIQPGTSSVPLMRPLPDDSEALEVQRVIRSGWVTQGPEVQAFESEFAQFVGAAHACAVSSCTAALHVALRALEVGPGDEVITASHSFIATANAVHHAGALPVFVDVDAATGNVDPAQVESALTPRTKAILAVHQLGMPCDLNAILTLAAARNVPVIEDAACAAGSEIRDASGWARIGRPHGRICCFSFHPRKLLTTGDGGMLTTVDEALDRCFRLLRHHGMSVSDVERHDARQVTFEEYTQVGYNYRLTDIQAAVGRVQLRRLPAIVQRRRELAARYRELLGAIPGLGVFSEPAWARSNWQTFAVRLPAGRDQRRVMQAMLEAGIATRRGVMCAHREPAYRGQGWRCIEGPQACGCPPASCRRLKTSERLQDETIALPMFHAMTDEEQRRVASTLAASLHA
jgi:dTDP-4-amino-4,6-dideoxygalactose transaminase